MRGKGSGRLGLLGMRERLEMVGGKFGIESVQGDGTTITAQIPAGNGGSHRANLESTAPLNASL
jgi:signal transduction histidine kinase